MGHASGLRHAEFSPATLEGTHEAIRRHSGTLPWTDLRSGAIELSPGVGSADPALVTEQDGTGATGALEARQ